VRKNRTRSTGRTPGSALRAALGIAGVWTAVGLFRAADRYFSDPFQLRRLEFGAWEALAQSLLSAYIWAALTPLVVAIARRELPRRSRWAAPVGILLAASVAFPVVHEAVYQVAYPRLMGIPSVLEIQLASLASVLPLSVPTQFVIFWAIVGATWTVTYAALSRERELRASQLETRLVSARLETLKMQLHPHFLFNTLNSILPLVFRDADAASRTVVRLADLLRLSLQNETDDLLPLRKEIELLQVYLEIQRTRFQDRLFLDLDVAPDVGDALVPNLILQPLVENAIKHGIAARPGAGRIAIRVFRENDHRLALRVQDDGPGPPVGARLGEGTGVGLRNTRDRLDLLFGEDHDFAFRGSPGRGCEVVLSIPFVYAPPRTLLRAAGERAARTRRPGREAAPVPIA
jgi:two-component sensor histidine kinase